jgi:predicted O-linked N-acetylglucosamine transferase (SPINDLY family)
MNFPTILDPSMIDRSTLLTSAITHHQAGRLAEADTLYRQILAIDPQNVDALHLLGVLATQTQQHAAGAELIRRAITLQPNAAVLHYNLGCALQGALRPAEAEAAFHQALALQPAYPEALNNLGDIRRDQKNYPDAERLFRRALALNPQFADAWTNLGVILKRTGRSQESIDAHRRAIALRPTFAIAHNNLANALLDAGFVPEALVALRHAHTLNLHDPQMHSNLLLAQFYDPDKNPADHVAEHRAYGAKFPPPPPIENQKSKIKNAVLRIAYLSPDFCDHSVAFFLEGLLPAHHADRVEVFCYADVHRPDATTARLQSSIPPDHWRDITPLTDAQAADLIRQDRIDILIDLAGHTANNRLPLFARKPAPLQLTTLGYLGTTGLSAIDFRLTDPFVDPPGMTDHLHTETLHRLPRTFACYRPPELTPPVSPLPALIHGHITFASLNMLYKLSPALLATWAKLLHRLPTARLAFMTRGLEDPLGQSRILHLLTAHGISPDRLTFTGKLPLADYLAAHAQFDILLDTFPINGHTITCNALWMGVPPITLAGTTYPQRLGCSVLSNLGLPELIATTPDQYLDIAAALATDLPRLADLRATLRQRLQNSPIMNAPHFATDLEDAYHTLWQKHHALS